MKNKITIRQKEGSGDTLMTGASTEVLLNGKPIPGLYSIKFEVEAKGVAKVHMSMYGSFDIEGTFDKSQITMVEKGAENDGKQMAETAQKA